MLLVIPDAQFEDDALIEHEVLGDLADIALHRELIAERIPDEHWRRADALIVYYGVPIDRTLITPEGVALRLRLGDAGQRAGAFLIDGVIILITLVAILIAAMTAVGAFGGAPAPSGAGAGSAEIAAAARGVREKGYRGLKLDPFECSGRDPDYALIRQAVERVAAVRDAVGPEMEILIDCHGRFSPASAIAIAKELEPYRLYWLEEPCDAENVGALAKVGRSIKTRLATGERCYTKYHLQALLRDCEVGVLQPDVIHVGGILEAKKIAAIADASYTPVSFHNPFGPVATAAALQLDACTTNVFMQESFCEYSEPSRFDLVEHAPRPIEGRYQLSELPGLGVGEFQLEAAKAHPFDSKAFLPMWSDDWRKRF